MEPIALNSVIKYISEDENQPQERVLWLDASNDSIVVFNLDDKKNTFPVWKKLSDIKYFLENNQCRLVEYQSKRLAIREEDLSDSDKVEWEKGWTVIKDLVTNEPDIYLPQNRGQLIKKTVQEHSVYHNYVYRKLRAYWKYGKVKSALLRGDFNKGSIPGNKRKYTGAKRGRPFKDKDCENIGMNITEDIKVVFSNAYEKFYNKRQQMTLKEAYYRMLQKDFNAQITINSKGRKEVSFPEPDKLPSFGAFKYWHPILTNLPDTNKARKGEIVAELNHRAVLGESTSEAYSPGSMFQIDATIADIYVVSRDNRNWIIGRPVLYIVIDVFSRNIVGFYVGLEGPSWLGAMMALYNTTRNKVELCKEYGIEIDENEWLGCNLPDALIVDRGELASTKPYNLINNLGIDVKPLPPYRADWKGIVEQTFRRLNQKTLKWLNGTVPRDFRVRVDKNYRKDALYNLEEFTKILIHSILYFNNARMDYYVRDEHMLSENVRPIPSKLWAWGIENRGGLLKTFPEDIIKLNLMPSEGARITFRGLQFKKMRYSCPEDIESGEYERARAKGSRKVKISYDPRDLRFVYLNEGLSYRKYYLLDTQREHLFLEEVDFVLEQEFKETRDNEMQKINDTASMNADIDDIHNSAKKDAKKQGASENKSTKDIRPNRKAEKEANRKADRWELGKEEGESIGKVIPFAGNKDDEYIPAPKYFDEED